MRNNWYKKSLVVGIIVLFIGVSVLSSVSSKDISVSDENMLEYDVESNENPEIEPVDDYNEILSFIENGQVYLKFKGSRPGFLIIFRHVEISTDPYRWVDLWGYKYPTEDDPGYYFSVEATHIIAPLFIGYYYPMSPDVDYINGIALGNIEWS